MAKECDRFGSEPNGSEWDNGEGIENGEDEGGVGGGANVKWECECADCKSQHRQYGLTYEMIKLPSNIF